jgi:osmoprotectant transport system permease protein
MTSSVPSCARNARLLRYPSMHKTLFALALSLLASSAAAQTVIGSKVFTESVVLAELGTQLLQTKGIDASHQRELGGTTVLWSGMLRGDIDCYPEYTGTLRAEIFAGELIESDDQLRAAMARANVWASPPLGFNNTYVLGMRKDVAQRSSISRLSDLRAQPQLRLAFSNEFLERADGWPGVRAAYGMPHQDVRGMAHDLAYRALAAGSIDVTDLYSTDAEIAYYDLIALADDRNFFPAYDALFVCRSDATDEVKAALSELAGKIDAAAMGRMNARAKLEHVPEAEVARQFATDALGLQTIATSETRVARIWRRTLEHLAMVALSLGAAVLIALPLGVVAFRSPKFGRGLFVFADVLQTIPALALLVFLIPWLGIGYAPAIVALFLYSLLPILRNTHTGLADIPRDLRESAGALGLSSAAQLRYVELPLAARSILAGIKTAAVINVGTATLGALIGAGGYGQPILTGIRLDDLNLILEGAIPAALLALVAQGLFGTLERRWVKAK